MSFETYLGTSLYDRPTRPAWNAVSIQSRFLRPLSNMLATAVSPAGPAPMMAAECMFVRGDRGDASCDSGRPPIYRRRSQALCIKILSQYVRTIANFVRMAYQATKNTKDRLIWGYLASKKTFTRILFSVNFLRKVMWCASLSKYYVPPPRPCLSDDLKGSKSVS